MAGSRARRRHHVSRQEPRPARWFGVHRAYNSWMSPAQLRGASPECALPAAAPQNRVQTPPPLPRCCAWRALSICKIDGRGAHLLVASAQRHQRVVSELGTGARCGPPSFGRNPSKRPGPAGPPSHATQSAQRDGSRHRHAAVWASLPGGAPLPPAGPPCGPPPDSPSNAAWPGSQAATHPPTPRLAACSTGQAARRLQRRLQRVACSHQAARSWLAPSRPGL